MPSLAASLMTMSRVMPSSTPSLGGGVMSTPLRTQKMFSPEPSATWPCSVSMMASS